MIIINLSTARDLSYRLIDTDNIKQIEYIVSFPSGYKHNFPVNLDKITGECIIHLPILKDIIQIEFDGMGYLRVEKTDGTIKELESDVVRFALLNRIDMSKDNSKDLHFNENLESINRMSINMKDVTISHSRTIDTIMTNINRNKK